MSHVSTGVRRLQAGALTARAYGVSDAEAIDKKSLVQSAREACEALKLRPAVRQVLMELAACYGDQKLEAGLIVWPSNMRLCDKTGLAERTIRLALSELQRQALIAPRDSANRKRYAVRRGGVVIDAFGFDLSPIWARREEFAQALLAEKHRREVIKRQFDEITAHRNAVEELLKHTQDADDLSRAYGELLMKTPRRSFAASVDELAIEWHALRNALEARFYAGCGGAGRRHKEQDNDLSTDSCQSISVAEVRAACPAVEGLLTAPIRSTDDFVRAGASLRGGFGASLDAWTEAVETVGPLQAAALVFYVMQLHDDDVASGQWRIKSPGGLFRSLTRRLALREFNLAAELAALRRRRQ